MNKDIYLPQYKAKSFRCPFCGVVAEQQWWNSFTIQQKDDASVNAFAGSIRAVYRDLEKSDIGKYEFSTCHNCRQVTVWNGKDIVYPHNSGVELHHPDMPEDVTSLYEEARSIVNLSPRASACLLRIALDTLMPHFGEKTGCINKSIGNLVANKGLSIKVQQSLDLLRVIGDNAAHITEMKIEDNRETALSLFSVLNEIVEEMITEPKRIDDMFNTLPAKAIKNIERRDSKVKLSDDEIQDLLSEGNDDASG
jgi:hypothetical protein